MSSAGRDRGRGGYRGGGRGGREGRGRDGGRGRGGGRFEGRGGGRGGGGGRGDPTRDWEQRDVGARANAAALQNALVKTEAARPREEGQLAVRPDKGGRCGRQMMVSANHFLVKCSATNAYHYDVEIKPVRERQQYGAEDTVAEGPQLLPQKLSREVIKVCAQTHKWPASVWAFDGKKNIYSPKEFLQKPKKIWDVSIPGERGERKFEVITQWANTVNLMDLTRYIEQGNIALPQDCLQTLEVTLRYGASCRPNCFSAGRSLYFNDPRTNQDLPDGAELWLGYHQSLRPCQFGLSLNIDTTASAFLKSRDVIEVMCEAAQVSDVNYLRQMTEQQWKRMRKAVAGLTIVTTHRGAKNQKRRVKGLTKESANRSMFETSEGVTNVADYWKKSYPALRFPFLPCLDVSKGDRKNYLPPEVCSVVAGQRQQKLTDKQTREVITFAAKRPEERKRGIEHALRSSGLSNDPLVKAFGMNINDQMTSVQARVLPQPHLQYTQPESMNTGTRGAWNLERIKFLKPCTITGWAFVNFERQDRVMVPGEQGLQTYTQELMKMLKELGMKIPTEFPVLVHGRRDNPLPSMQQAYQNAQQKFGKVDLMLVCLPTTDSRFYRAVKHAGSVVLGVTTQCFVANKAGIGSRPRGRLQYLANLGMKINHKCGGTNCQVTGPVSRAFPVVGSKPFIVFGADVTHPTGFDESEPSVAAIVASMDPSLAQFVTRIIVQEHRQELINMKLPVKDLLKSFYLRTKMKPESIIFYRDGVSEGQFSQVLEHEYNEIRAACSELEAGYTPPITFIVVQKRHHTRLTPVDSRDGDRNGNIVPGTVVDTGIVSPRDFDFYLNSHAGIQGTNKAAHYHVLVDENKFGSDGVQLMSYWMCYLYCRCTRSVSYAPPAYYAHLAALQGKILFQESASETDGEGGAPMHINRNLENVMFYV